MPLSRLERIRLTKQEQKAAQMIGAPLVLLLIVTGKALWKVKRLLALLLLFIFVFYGASTISGVSIEKDVHADAPVLPAPTTVQETQFQQIKDYIRQVFGPDASDAFKILSCENRGLNPNATGHNTDGSTDYGIFQINSIHGVPSQYLYDYKINVDIAYHIFKEQGWNPWACQSVWHALERNDTI